MKCFYHSSDLDGHCSGAIIKHAFSECEMIGINYGQPFPWESIKEGEVVFMVDFCLQPFEDMKKLNRLCRLVWIDHHASGSISEATAQRFVASGGQVLDSSQAACELTWSYVFPLLSIPRAVFYLGRHDVWDHTDPLTLPFQYGLRLRGNTSPDQAFWGSLFHASDLDISVIADAGKLIIEYEISQNAKFCQTYAFETKLSTANGLLRAICVNRTFCNSSLFNSVYDPDKHDIMIAFGRLNKRWVVSLYTTKDNIDCGAVALSYKGGGHKKAAGFTCDELPFGY